MHLLTAPSGCMHLLTAPSGCMHLLTAHPLASRVSTLALVLCSRFLPYMYAGSVRLGVGVINIGCERACPKASYVEL